MKKVLLLSMMAGIALASCSVLASLEERAQFALRQTINLA